MRVMLIISTLNLTPDKSKCMSVPCIRQTASSADKLSDCNFYLDGRRMENVREFSHLGHIITARLDDADDILQWSFRGGTRGNAVPIVKNLPERIGTAFPLLKR